MARWNRPCAAGVAISVVTEIAPADSPKTVTCPGSPPKAAMLSRTHSRAAIWSRRPRFDSIGPLGRPVAGEVEVAERAEAVVDGDEEALAATHEVVAAVGGGRRRPDDERAAVEPDHHGARFVGRGGRGADVERQAVLAHRRVPAGADELADALLDRHGPVLRAVARALPRHHGLRGAQAEVADGRRGVGDTAPGVHVVRGDAPDDAAGGLDLGTGSGGQGPRAHGPTLVHGAPGRPPM